MKIPSTMILTAISGVLLATSSIPASAASLVMRNATSDQLTVFVNDKQGCTAEPGKDCSTEVASGQVSLRAVSPDGRTTYDRLTIQDAIMIWTVRYYQPTTSGPGEKPAPK